MVALDIISKTTFNTDQPLGKAGLGKIRGETKGRVGPKVWMDRVAWVWSGQFSRQRST